MTNAELAVLSLIAEKPCHGYEIEQLIVYRGMRNWTEIGFSSIYYLLKKLKGKGWVEVVDTPAEGRGPARKVYHLTQEGREVWVTSSLDALREPQPSHSSFHLGLANLPTLPVPEAVSALGHYRKILAARRDEAVRTRANQREDRELPDHVEAMFDLSLTMIDAEIGWLDGFTQRFAESRKVGKEL